MSPTYPIRMDVIRLRFPHHSRLASRVVFNDGATVTFDERLSKYSAFQQATALRDNGYTDQLTEGPKSQPHSNSSSK